MEVFLPLEREGVCPALHSEPVRVFQGHYDGAMASPHPRVGRIDLYASDGLDAPRLGGFLERRTFGSKRCGVEYGHMCRPPAAAGVFGGTE